MILLAICLSACNHVATLDVPQRIYDQVNNRCVERLYRFSADYIGVIGPVRDVDLSMCDKVIGYTPKNYAEVSTWIEKRRREIKKEIDKRSK